MRTNKALFDRALDMPPVNENNVMMYRKATSYIDQYNILARDKGLPIKKIPAYNRHMNCAMIANSIDNILSDIDNIKDIPDEEEEKTEEEEEEEMKIARDVEFTVGIIEELSELSAWKDNDGLWYYIQNGDDICVYADTEAMIARLGSSRELILDYADMPYELLIDSDGKEWKVNKYIVDIEYSGSTLNFGLFGYRSRQTDWNSNVNGRLTSLTLHNWTNRNVTNMSHMFYQCLSLESIDLSTFSTGRAEDMSSMFESCGSLITINLSNFNTSAVTNMSHMFDTCSSLTTINLSDFNTSRVEDMSWMFLNCLSLESLDLSNFNTSVVTNISQMFNSCRSLNALNLSDFNTSRVEDMSWMFVNCLSLASLTLQQTATSIIKALPSDTWTVKNNNSENVSTVTIQQGSSATWDPEEPTQWMDTPWTLSRTI